MVALIVGSVFLVNGKCEGKIKRGKIWVDQSELHIQDNIFFASAKRHVHFAVAPFFLMTTFLFFSHTSNPLVVLRKKILR